ncbi:mobile mystery protein B [Aquisphaera insulae]|uniref:mobile mystery protein B n=1 Tax=Aquisphaera insulae TaxID=2712864 RepID=UPI0013EBB69E|nr:mobile mystery protein B [Aquisphaera insulae]
MVDRIKVIFGDSLPGETPIDDASGLKIFGLTTRAQLNFEEARNIRKALLKYFGGDLSEELAPFDLEWSKALHREMFGDVWDWAGLFRSRDLNLGAPWLQVPQRLHDLFEDLRFWETEGIDLMIQATRLHHRAVAIHPFLNGNGRWARMLTNIWLHLHGLADIAWPAMEGTTSPIRGEYIEALKSADNGDEEPLLSLHRQYLRDEPPPAS